LLLIETYYQTLNLHTSLTLLDITSALHDNFPKRERAVRRIFITVAILAVSSTLLFTPAHAKKITGVIYHDANKNALSNYEQQLDPADVLLPNIDVYLLTSSDKRSTKTSEYGTFTFADVSAGTYLLVFGIDPKYGCTSHNRAIRIPEAIREGHVDVVAIGDSIGVLGSDRPYPVRLAEHFSNIVDTTLDNLAIGGSASWEWLPGADKGYFDDRLVPALPDADVVTITLGGNDLAPYVSGGPPYDPIEIVKAFIENPYFILDIIPNIKAIIEKIRELNPDCDVVFVVYPNFGNSHFISDYVDGTLQQLVSFAMKVGMSIAREEVGKIKNVVLADMFGALGDSSLDPYLIDVVHPNDAGHQLYADVIFMSLGGVLLGDESSNDSRLVGFDAPDLVPDDDSQDDDSGDDASDDDGGHENNSNAGCGLSI